MEFSVEKWHELCMAMERFEEEFYGRFSCDPEALTMETIKSSRAREAILSEWVMKFADMYHRTKVYAVSSASKIEELRGKVTKRQEEVITLQDELLKSKDEQLSAVQRTVRNEMTSVQTAVKAELGSWSEVVKRTTTQAITPTSLIEAVKSAVCEEDKSRNIMIFGKPDVVCENLSQIVADIFEDVGEKPLTIDCRRIGAIRTGKCRPIKVKLASAEVVSHVLRKAKVLKSSEGNRSTYIVADRNQEERESYKKLIDQMKAKIKQEPGLYHFIKGGQIASTARRPVKRQPHHG